MSMVNVELHETFRRVRDEVERRGVRVYIGDVLDPNTGSFDGAEIGIDYANDLEMSLFVLLHLFGHTAQWCTVPVYRTIDERVRPGAPPEVIEEARAYEQEASRLGLTLLHASGIRDRDLWMSDWSGSDWRYLSTFYATGVLPIWSACRSSGHPPLEPLPIPDFVPRRFHTRYAF
jgi:hypothetical protein